MGDVIYRQDAIRVLNAKCKKAFNLTCGEEDCACAEYMALRDLPSAQQWIPVEKETPILPNIVLVCDSLGKILFDSYIDGSWTYCPYVVAWMPLPEPYREEVSD